MEKLMRCINRFLIYLIVLFLFDNRAIAANFSVAGGYLYDPSGAKFIPEGTNVFDYNTSEILQDSAGYPLRKIFPNINYIRVMVYNLLIIPPRGTPVSISYPSASNFKRIADLCQTTKIVCEFEDHSSNGGYWEDGKGHFNWGRSIPPTGKLLGSALAFWKEMATQFKDKPYAWIGSL